MQLQHYSLLMHGAAVRIYISSISHNSQQQQIYSEWLANVYHSNRCLLFMLLTNYTCLLARWSRYNQLSCPLLRLSPGNTAELLSAHGVNPDQLRTEQST